MAAGRHHERRAGADIILNDVDLANRMSEERDRISGKGNPVTATRTLTARQFLSIHGELNGRRENLPVTRSMRRRSIVRG